AAMKNTRKSTGIMAGTCRFSDDAPVAIIHPNETRVAIGIRNMMGRYQILLLILLKSNDRRRKSMMPSKSILPAGEQRRSDERVDNHEDAAWGDEADHIFRNGDEEQQKKEDPWSGSDYPLL